MTSLSVGGGHPSLNIYWYLMVSGGRREIFFSDVTCVPVINPSPTPLMKLPGLTKKEREGKSNRERKENEIRRGTR